MSVIRWLELLDTAMSLGAFVSGAWIVIWINKHFGNNPPRKPKEDNNDE